MMIGQLGWEKIDLNIWRLCLIGQHSWLLTRNLSFYISNDENKAKSFFTELHRYTITASKTID